MGIGRYNSEGYKDLVPQMAIAEIEKAERKELHIEHLSDAEFNRFAEEMKGYAKENCSIKEYAELQLAARKAYGVTSDNSALNILPLDIMSERNAKEVWDEIDSHTPSDNIYLIITSVTEVPVPSSSLTSYSPETV